MNSIAIGGGGSHFKVPTGQAGSGGPQRCGGVYLSKAARPA